MEADDTGVLVLFLHYYFVYKLSLLVIMISSVKEREVINIRRDAQKNRDIVTDLLYARTISGCNTLIGYFGKGKRTFIQMLNVGNSIRL